MERDLTTKTPLTPEQAANYMGVDVAQVKEWMADESLRSVTPEGRPSHIEFGALVQFVGSLAQKDQIERPEN